MIQMITENCDFTVKYSCVYQEANYEHPVKVGNYLQASLAAKFSK